MPGRNLSCVTQQQRAAAQEKERHGKARNTAPEQALHPWPRPDPEIKKPLARCVNQQNTDNGKALCKIDLPQDVYKRQKEMPPCILLKSDGATLYATTDLATIVQREQDFHPGKILYLTDKRQSLHFEQVFRVARKAALVPPRCV